MLSRFSKLLSNPTQPISQNIVYEKAEIDSSVSEMKKLGKRAVDNSDECLRDIETILRLMKKYSHAGQVQRVGCHALSNLAMHVVAARWIIQKNGFRLIEKAVARFSSDHKLCWLASSAVWNLARPPTNRAVIGARGVKLMFAILAAHVSREKVCNTAIGALSNLSLQDDLKDLIARPENLDVILRALSTHRALRSLSVMTSGAGLLANLAVNDEHAEVLVEKGTMAVLMDLLGWNSQQQSEKQTEKKNEKQDDEREQTLFRNSCAALNNLVTAGGFLDAFLAGLGIEKVLRFLDAHRDNELYVSLLENCLLHLDCDSNMATTSFHLAAYHGKLAIFKGLYEAHKHEFELDSRDEHELTVLDYAISKEHPQMVALLAKCGATKHSVAEDDERMTADIRQLIQSGSRELKTLRSENNKALIEALPHFPVDVCQYMLTFQHNVDLLKGVNQF